jgi:hypothetical protein
MSHDRYPEIEALDKTIEKRGLRLSVVAGDAGRADRCLIGVASHANPSVTISVDDEYGDASDDNPALLLHLVLAECEGWEAARGLRSWASEAGLDPLEPWVGTLFDELGRVVPMVRSMTGDGAKAISSWDVQMNSGAARALRERSASAAAG